MECYVFVCLILPLATLGPKTTGVESRKLRKGIDIYIEKEAIHAAKSQQIT